MCAANLHSKTLSHTAIMVPSGDAAAAVARGKLSALCKDPTTCIAENGQKIDGILRVRHKCEVQRIVEIERESGLEDLAGGGTGTLKIHTKLLLWSRVLNKGLWM